MNRLELIAAVSDDERVNSTKTEIGNIVNATLDAVCEALKSGDSVRLGEFGTFKVIDRAARTGRIPTSGKAVSIPAHKTVKFTPATVLRDSLNK